MGTMQRKQEPVEGTGEVRTGVGRVSRERQREEYTGNNLMKKETARGKDQSTPSEVGTCREVGYLNLSKGRVNYIAHFFRQPSKCPENPSGRL